MVDDLFSSSHPLLPPKTEDDQLDWLRLLRSRRVGISTFYRLLAEHGTAQNALEHLPDIAQSRGLAGYRACSQKDAMRESNMAHDWCFEASPTIQNNWAKFQMHRL